MGAFVQRFLVPQLLTALADTPIVYLGGARQVGKSTLVKELLPGATYLTLDDAVLLGSAQADPLGFLETLRWPRLA